MEKLVFLFLIISIIAISESRYLAKREENTGPAEAATPAEVAPDVKEQEVAAPGGSDVAAEVVNGDSSKSDTNETDIKSRFGFNMNRGQAMAVGPYGMGMSQAATYGMNMGIMRPGMRYQPLFGQSGGYANTMNTGLGAPMTYAGGYNRYGGMGMMGGMNAGYYGGRGQAMTNSYSMYQKIPMGMDGTALYSNLKSPSNKAGADAGNAATPENSEVGQMETETTNEEAPPAEGVTKNEQEEQGEELANEQPLNENEQGANN